jgi:hypothetical protein
MKDRKINILGRRQHEFPEFNLISFSSFVQVFFLCHSQELEISPIFRELVSYCFVVISSCSLLTRRESILSFLSILNHSS